MKREVFEIMKYVVMVLWLWVGWSSSGDLRNVIFPEYTIADVNSLSRVMDEDSVWPGENFL